MKSQEEKPSGGNFPNVIFKTPPEIKRTIFRDFADIKEFYLEEEQKIRLEKMRPLFRLFYLCGWLLKSLFFKLTPIRRLLLLGAGIILILEKNEIHVGAMGFVFNLGSLGALILVFILMLELKDKLLARNELAEGRAIQMRLLPESSPMIVNWDVWLHSEPANDVGGDLVDCIRFNDNHHILVLGDVSGKGLPAALLMVKLQATIRALYTESIRLSDLGAQINGIFHRDGITRSFATLVVLDIHGDSGKIRMLNAGHTPPVCIRNGRPHVTGKGNPALGLMADTGYSVTEESLQKGDIFLVYSDGINESRNQQGECFGNDRLFALFSDLSETSSANIGARILKAVHDFSGEIRPDDDQTLLVIRYMG
jgi:serine phosphatase RsbU (regulator of sigma subunit)